MGGGNSSAQREAQRSEEARQAAIRQGSAQVESIFSSPERQQQYQDFYSASRELGMGDLNKQKAQADRSAKFALARGGLTGGSRARDVGTQMGQDYLDGLLTVDRRAQGSMADLMGADQQSKQNLLGLVQSGLDVTTANSSAASAMRANHQAGEATRMAGGLGELFGTAASMKNASEAERIRRQAEIQYGNTVYSPWHTYGSRG